MDTLTIAEIRKMEKDNVTFAYYTDNSVGTVPEDYFITRLNQKLGASSMVALSHDYKLMDATQAFNNSIHKAQVRDELLKRQTEELDNLNSNKELFQRDQFGYRVPSQEHDKLLEELKQRWDNIGFPFGASLVKKYVLR
jgi:hypothetical protein